MVACLAFRRRAASVFVIYLMAFWRVVGGVVALETLILGVEIRRLMGAARHWKRLPPSGRFFQCAYRRCCRLD